MNVGYVFRRPQVVAAAMLVCLLAFRGVGRAEALEWSGVQKVLFFGNSITLSYPGPSYDWDWGDPRGMAATLPENDYVHLVAGYIGNRSGQMPEIQISRAGNYEVAGRAGSYADLGSDLDYYLDEMLPFNADIVVIAIGENISPLVTEQEKEVFRNSFSSMLSALANSSSHPAIFVRGSFWSGHEDADQIMRECAESVGGSYVDISTLCLNELNYGRSEYPYTNEGVGAHPGDVGMAAIADAIVGVMAADPSSVTSVVYATSDTLLESFNIPALDGRIIREGITSTTDLAADSDDVYTASGGRIYRLPDGHFAGYVRTEWNDYTSVAALPDSYVYAANSNSIWRFNADLSGGAEYMAVSNITDLAVNSAALYGTSGGRIYSFPGSEVWGSYSDWNDYTSVTASGDYVYAFAASYNSIWRFNVDLTGGIEYVTGVGGITDLSVDGTILYGTSGGKIYSFPELETWGPISEGGDFTSLAAVETPLGSPPAIGDVTVEYLGASALALTWTTGVGYDYTVLEKDDLTSSTWSTNQSGIPGGAGSVTVTTAVDSVQAFYKVTSE